MDLDRVFELLRALQREKVQYTLIGGVALNFHGLARTTEDIDLLVSPDPDNVSRIKRALQSVFSDPEIEKISAADLGGEYPTIRYGPPNDPFVIDLISHFGTAASFADVEAEERDIEGIKVRIATPRALYRLKKDTVRPVDRADAEALRRHFGI